MENVAHWECPIPGHGSWPVRIGDDPTPRCGRYPDGQLCAQKLIEVEYVRADLHQGAVDALRWYADPANYDAIGPKGTVKGAAWRLREDNGERARRALGGQ